MLSNGSCALITTYEGSKLTSVTAISQVHISSAESCEQITRCTGSGRLSLHRCYDLRVVQAAVFVSLAGRLLDAIAGRSSLIGGSTSCVDVLRSHAWTVLPILFQNASNCYFAFHAKTKPGAWSTLQDSRHTAASPRSC